MCPTLSFDLSTLPAGTTAGDVEKATVLLWVNAVNAAGSITVRPVISWSELGVTYNTQPGVGAPLPAITIPAVNQYLAIDVTSQVQSWLAHPGTNNGLALVAVGSASLQFDSKETNGITPRLRPFYGLLDAAGMVALMWSQYSLARSAMRQREWIAGYALSFLLAVATASVVQQ